MLFTSVRKAVPRGERARIESLLARESARVRRAFRRFLDDVRSDDVRRQVRLALERRGVEDALQVIDAHVVRLGGVVTQVFQNAAAAEAPALVRQLGRAHIAVTFDPTYPRAAELMRRNRLEFVREFTRGQRQTTRAALVEALQIGAGPIQTARIFRDSIGLTEVQRGAVANYRRLLEDGDSAALARDLRDRRFDPSVARAIADEEPLGAEKISRMVDQYRNRYLQYRAETIARTETLRTIAEARREALEQVLEQVGLPRGTTKRTWRATQDARTRDTHAEMDEQVRGMDEPFESPSGVLLMFPGDPGAPPEEVINCRCTETYSIEEEGGEEALQ